jgi:DNA ligase-1
MTFSKLATYFQKLDRTTKRLEITAILAELIKSTSASEIDKILYLAAGRLGPLFNNTEFNLADKMMLRVLALAYNKPLAEITKQFGKQGDLGDVIKEISPLHSLSPLPSLSIEEVYETLLDIASDSGSGSQDRKVQKFATLLKKVDALSAKYLVRIPLGKLRLGFSDLTVLDALSVVETGSKSARKEIERAYNVYPDIGRVAQVLRQDGLKGLNKIRLTAGVPVLPERCSLVTSHKEMLEKSDHWAVQPKYDGMRVQIHYGVKPKTDTTKQVPLIPSLSSDSSFSSSTRIFSRGLEDITASMPEIAEAATTLTTHTSHTNFVFDGEAISVDPKTGKLLAFDETVTRKRKHGVATKSEEAPLKVFVFDLLLLNNEDLTQKPYHERYAKLSALISPTTHTFPIQLTPSKTISNPQAISDFFKKETAAGLEGIVAKKPDSPYTAGARNFAWVKMKREEAESELTDTIDCVVLGYYQGEGKRNSFGIGAFLVGVYDPKDDVFKTVAKIGTGVTDEEWRELKRKCDEIKINKPSPRVTIPTTLTPHTLVEPKIVVAVRADMVTKSPLHSSGYSLRFPRLISYREKLPEDVNTIHDLSSLGERLAPKGPPCGESRGSPQVPSAKPHHLTNS